MKIPTLLPIDLPGAAPPDGVPRAGGQADAWRRELDAVAGPIDDGDGPDANVGPDAGSASREPGGAAGAAPADGAAPTPPRRGLPRPTVRPTAPGDRPAPSSFVAVEGSASRRIAVPGSPPRADSRGPGTDSAEKRAAALPVGRDAAAARSGAGEPTRIGRIPTPWPPATPPAAGERGVRIAPTTAADPAGATPGAEEPLDASPRRGSVAPAGERPAAPPAFRPRESSERTAEAHDRTAPRPPETLGLARGRDGVVVARASTLHVARTEASSTSAPGQHGELGDGPIPREVGSTRSAAVGRTSGLAASPAEPATGFPGAARPTEVVPDLVTPRTSSPSATSRAAAGLPQGEGAPDPLAAEATEREAARPETPAGRTAPDERLTLRSAVRLFGARLPRDGNGAPVPTDGSRAELRTDRSALDPRDPDVDAVLRHARIAGTEAESGAGIRSRTPVVTVGQPPAHGRRDASRAVWAPAAPEAASLEPESPIRVPRLPEALGPPERPVAAPTPKAADLPATDGAREEPGAAVREPAPARERPASVSRDTTTERTDERQPGPPRTESPSAARHDAAAGATRGAPGSERRQGVQQPTPLRPSELAQAILSRARAMPQSGAVQMRFALEPADLGAVRVRIESLGDRLHVEITVSSSAAADTLQSGLARLSAQLQEAGFPKPEIDLGLDASHGHAQREGQPAPPGRRGARPQAPAADASPARPAASAYRDRPDDGRLDLLA